jgi:uncharacterized protein
MAAPNLARGSTGIDLRGVPDGCYPLTLSGSGLVVDAELSRVLDEFRFEGSVSWTPGDRRIRGVLEGRYRSTCDRCLVPFERGVRVDLDVPVILAEEPGAKEADDAAVRTSASEPDLDLAGPFRAAVLLEVPIKNLCREDCRGLCPVCGADRNAGNCACQPTRGDPRWEALGGLAFPPSEE